jgi:ComF family protein
MCSRPSRNGQTHLGCRTPQGLDGLTSIFAYRGVIKKAIRKLKYQFVSDLAQDLTELFLSFCGEDKVFTRQLEKAVFIPLPLHPSRKRWRGFDQTELLGKMMTSNLGIEFLPQVLKRIKKTKLREELSRKERQKDIQGAFQVSSIFSPASASKIILFNDLWFWGESLREATKVLKKNGAKQVWGLTLARETKN